MNGYKKSNERRKKINTLKKIKEEGRATPLSGRNTIQVMYAGGEMQRDNMFFQKLTTKEKASAIASKGLKDIKQKEDTKKMVNKNRRKIAAKEIVKNTVKKITRKK